MPQPFYRFWLSRAKKMWLIDSAVRVRVTVSSKLELEVVDLRLFLVMEVLVVGDAIV